MGHSSRKGIWTLAVCAALAAGVSAEDRGERPWERQLAAQQAREAHRAEEMRRVYRRQWSMALARMRAHARMPNTMYASTPTSANTDVSCPALVDPATRRAYERWVRERPGDPLRGTERRFGAQRAPRVLPQGRAGRAAATTAVVARTDGAHGPVPVAATAAAAATAHAIPYFPSASDALGREGFARIVNHSDEAGTVGIVAVDDAGSRSELTLSIGARETKHFNSPDLEGGNPLKGLAGAAGPGQGGWRLELASDLDIEALSYIRTTDGFLTAMHDTAPFRDGAYRVVVFNPGSNQDQASLLRLVNPGGAAASAAIAGTDDRGVAGGEVSVEIPAGESRTYTAAELESGSAPGLRGSLRDGTGKWRLDVSSGEALVAMSLLSSPTGHLTNLSTAPGNEAEGVHSVPLFPSASDMHGREGFVRVVNRADTAGEVSIEAFDDTDRTYPALTLSIGAGETKHFNSPDLEDGNADKGLTGSTGAGQGDWRLELSSELDIEVLAYIRTTDGFLTAMHDVAPRTGMRHRVAVFNPGNNANQQSLLRLVNAGDGPAEVAIAGTDDAGASPGGEVALTVPAGASRTLTAQELESGGAGFTGALGDGARKWSLDVESDGPIVAMSLLSSPTGHLTNLSTAPGRDAPQETVAEVFRTLISPIVQGKCVNCHVEGGASGNTRLVFVRDTDAGHLAKNLKVFEDFLAEEDDGAGYILNKIQGALGHGGGIQVTAGTDEFAAMERFLGLLGEEVDTGTSVTVATLFDGVEMESWRSTLRRAAVVFAGRNPTDEEYASIDGGTGDDVRAAIRGLMQGPEFHEFLLRASNDRLFTDRELDRGWIIENDGRFVDFDNKVYDLQVDAINRGDEQEFRRWVDGVQFGVGRAPLELIAHVVENDLPYTTVLTADYIMANGLAAEAYGSTTEFEEPENAWVFGPSRIERYYRIGEGHVAEYDPVVDRVRVLDPGPLITDYPHAGILNTTVFLLRYPTTPTNRNRARSRWTYYHFLGIDIEKSASRTTDPVALADTNNPTMHNPVCTVCHSVLDPVAGAFQNYGDEGLFRDQWGGLDALDDFYKEVPWTAGNTNLEITASSASQGQSVWVSAWLGAGEQLVRIEPGFDPPRPEGSEIWWHMGIGEVSVRDVEGVVVDRVKLQDVAATLDLCGSHKPEVDGATGEEFYESWFCRQEFRVDIPEDGVHVVETRVWAPYEHEDASSRSKVVNMSVGGYQQGDTWYRDMRGPGFDREDVPDTDASLRWLAERIVSDERFAEATVRFWWPAIMGSEVAPPPEGEDDAGFEGLLLASTAQAAEVARLARGFRRGFGAGSAYDLKDLLVEFVLSRWFRAHSSDDDEPVRASALARAGANRLLTPEELARKTLALTGFQWGRIQEVARRSEPVHEQRVSALTGRSVYRLLYGGIDSDGVTERASDLSSVMAGVAQSHSLESSCPIVMKELFLLPKENRKLLVGVDREISPIWEYGRTFNVKAARWDEKETVSLRGEMQAGGNTLTLSFLNAFYDEETREGRFLRLDRLRVRDGEGHVLVSRELEDLEPLGDCNHPVGDHFALHCSGSLEVPVEVPTGAEYDVEVVVWADQIGDELATMTLSVGSDAERSAGSRVIKGELVSLYDKLFGLTLSTDSPTVEAAYELFVDAWNRKRTLEGDFGNWEEGIDCNWTSDQRYLDGIVENAFVYWDDWDDERGQRHDWDWDRIDAHFETINWSDPHGVARAWVVVLAYFLMDYRYLYL